jgi:glyoxylase-like metal-dependent hydrolase (beta-lactamase superfamily II)
MTERITEGIWKIDCRTRDRPNVYLVRDDGWTLIDAGWPGDEDTVRDGLDEVGCRLAALDRGLLTHYDADHVGTLGGLTPELDAPIYIHEQDAPFVAGQRLPPWTARNGIETLQRLYYSRLELPDLPVERIQDGDTVDAFRAYHTPGHTPGHTAYVHETSGTVFLGDLAWERGGTLRPSGRITSYDRSQVEASIRTLVDQLPEITHICPGHGRTLDAGVEQLSQTVD